MYKVLLVEDTEECQIVVKRALSSASISSSVEPSIELMIAPTFKAAMEMIRSQIEFHLAIFDLGLPDGDGLTVFEEARRLRPAMPTFLLTSSSDLDSKVTAFNLGADDYLMKPISAVELRARVEMRLKKTQASATTRSILKRGSLVLDLSILRATVESTDGAAALALTAKEFKILAVLMQNEGRVYSRQELLKHVWGADFHITERTVDSHIFGLRKKLGPHADQIEAIPHVGYRFVAASA